MAQLDAAFVIADAVYPICEPNPTRTRRAMVDGPGCDRVFLANLVLQKPGFRWRADRSIIPVFERLGLVDYWRSTGKWPDFCDEREGEDTAKAVCAKLKGDQPALIPRTDYLNSLGERPISASAAGSGCAANVWCATEFRQSKRGSIRLMEARLSRFAQTTRILSTLFRLSSLIPFRGGANSSTPSRRRRILRP